MLDTLLAAIHATPLQMALAVTGGGSQAIADLLATPGASRTVLEATVPYADRALDEYLQARPEHYCAERTARLIAMAAYQRATRLTRGGGLVAGVGATASLASDRPKRGAHRLHVAVQTESATWSTSVELTKGARTRRQEERLAADIVLDLIAQVAGIATRPPLAWLPGETPHATQVDAPLAWRQLFTGRRRLVAVEPAAPSETPSDTDSTPEVSDVTAVGRAIMPGAFNPRHDGHRGMAQVAASLLGRPVEFELSIWNVDKPPLDYVEIARRVAQFGPQEAGWLTRAPTFVEKSRLFPRATFVVGADTIVRIGDPKYYCGDERKRDEALAALAAAGSRFLVFGRAVAGRFESLADLTLPDALRTLCDGCPESRFRLDVSSTELRSGEKASVKASAECGVRNAE